MHCPYTGRKIISPLDFRPDDKAQTGIPSIRLAKERVIFFNELTGTVEEGLHIFTLPLHSPEQTQ